MKILSMILSFFIGFFSYPISFLPENTAESFIVVHGDFTENSVFLDGKETEISLSGDYVIQPDGTLDISGKITITFDKYFNDWFNYYCVALESDSYIEGEIVYKAGLKEKSEDFFVEKGENVFASYIDNCLDKVKANALISVSFEPLENDSASVLIKGFSLMNRAVPEQEIYLENGKYKIGIDLLWGGALSYLEDLDSNVEAVNVDGLIKVDSNASSRYSAKAVNKNVNLINRNDTGRLIQQSYYGTSSGGYECGEYMGNKWNYNPVQGGNQFNENSKIVDLFIDDDSVYIKCRPLDWAKSKEHITPSYMEATYSFVEDTVHVSCRFIDFSGLPETYTTQELPAFYCVEPLNRYVYYTENGFACEPDLIFWPDAGYPNFTSVEGWSAFIGDFDDSFGIGLYCPGETNFLAGVYARGTTSQTDPSRDPATSYIALVKYMNFKSFAPFEYDFYLTTGDKNEIRSNFNYLK